MNVYQQVVLSSEFMPHGMCYLWRPGVLGLHVISDALITLAYFSIPVTLVYFVRKRRDLVFHWVFVCFAVFIVACGTTHLMEIWVIWHPTYWLSGSIKAVTALVSVPTAVLLVKLVPQALQLPSPAALQRANAELEQEIAERKRAEAEIARMHEQLLATSRRAGMAEVATNVLHNVGNVLNSVNVSADLIATYLRKSNAPKLANVVAMLQKHEGDLGAFIQDDAQGQHLVPYLGKLSAHLQSEQAATFEELRCLQANIEHIKEIVVMQQSYAKVAGVNETITVSSLVEDSLQLSAGVSVRHCVDIIRDFRDSPVVEIDKHKALQILLNLVRNARQACDESGRPDPRLTMRIVCDPSHVEISVIDNGIGVAPENRTRIFNHGFTTRAEGRGFGLHSGALAARELGGSLTMHSEGLGQGATFTLRLPICIRDLSARGVNARASTAPDASS